MYRPYADDAASAHQTKLVRKRVGKFQLYTQSLIYRLKKRIERHGSILGRLRLRVFASNGPHDLGATQEFIELPLRVFGQIGARLRLIQLF
jgi:hypothetical protein